MQRFLFLLFALSLPTLAIGNSLRFCGPADYASIGFFSIHNNVYGAKSISDALKHYTQCISSNFNERMASAVITWKFALPSKGVKSYPHLSYGWDWNGAQLYRELPIQVNKLRSARFRHSITLKSDSPLNVSYDIWISNESNPSRTTLTDEIMIWIIDNNSNLLTGPSELVEIDGRSYRLFSRKANPKVGDWNYFAFVSEKPQPKSTIDVASFVQHLKATSKLRGTILNGVSFGPELMEGEGSLEIEDFQIELIN